MNRFFSIEIEINQKNKKTKIYENSYSKIEKYKLIKKL